MAALLLITGKGVAQGFRLGGFKCREIEEDSDIDEVIEEEFESGGLGLICVEERFHERISDRVLKRVRKHGLPVIISMDIPGRWDEAATEESHIARLIRRAIGYQMKLKK